MCTVTFIARRHGYALGMNRDEKISRVQGLPPSRQTVRGRAAIFPSEPAGGTWIGVNDARVTFALINWYSVSTRVSGPPLSRGRVTLSVLGFDDEEAAHAHLLRYPLERTNPFRLIGIFPGRRSVVEWRWDLRGLQRIAHDWQTNLWSSSGYDEPGAQQSRKQQFEEALRQTSAGGTNWLRRLHRSHGPQLGPYSTCMHREDAATVSYTEITVLHQTATMGHTTGAPCCSPASRLSRFHRLPCQSGLGARLRAWDATSCGTGDRDG